MKANANKRLWTNICQPQLHHLVFRRRQRKPIGLNPGKSACDKNQSFTNRAHQLKQLRIGEIVVYGSEGW